MAVDFSPNLKIEQQIFNGALHIDWHRGWKSSSGLSPKEGTIRHGSILICSLAIQQFHFA
jgi:hypothetical protein